MQTWQDRLKEISAQFPNGCKIRRKPGTRITECTRLEEATVSSVVATGIHRDVFLKIGDWFSTYLNPEHYEVINEDCIEISLI